MSDSTLQEAVERLAELTSPQANPPAEAPSPAQEAKPKALKPRPEDERPPPRLLRFRDLKARGIVGNHPTLKRWVERQGFPPGRMLGPNTRAWLESEVEAWLASRPIKNTERGERAHVGETA
jgi:predicted DNA-binding transcriptional regulator AlpA